MKTSTKLISISLLSLTILSACGSYTPDRSYMTKESINNEEKRLQDAKDKYSQATTDEEKQKQLFEIGFRSQALGDYNKAISTYEKVLEKDSVHYPALNNLAAIYEEMKKIDKALEYEKRLYDSNPTNLEVVGDVIRLLVENEQFDDAQGVLEKLTSSGAAKGNELFISDKYSFINDARKKQGK